MPKPRKIPAFDLNNYLLKDPDEIPLTFGKHAGLTPLEIAREDPSYLIWAYETFTLKPCTKDLYELCKLTSDEEPIRETLSGNLRFK